MEQTKHGNVNSAPVTDETNSCSKQVLKMDVLLWLHMMKLAGRNMKEGFFQLHSFPHNNFTFACSPVISTKTKDQAAWQNNRGCVTIRKSRHYLTCEKGSNNHPHHQIIHLKTYVITYVSFWRQISPLRPYQLETHWPKSNIGFLR